MVGISSSVHGRRSGGLGTLPVRTPARIRGSGPSGGCVPDPGPSSPRGVAPSRTRSLRTPPRIHGTPSSEFPSVAVCDLRGHERIAERAFELPADLDDADLHPGL